jgi:hypothetical protein
MRARPRLLLLVALAFALETLRPIGPALMHQHPGGEHDHVHAPGKLAHDARRHRHDAPPGASSRRHDAGPALANAPDSGAHTHLLSPFHHVDLPVLAPFAPDLPLVPVPESLVVGGTFAPPASGLARAPPAALT